ncbi:hypothetical protein V6N13_092240 [Hibiscus sabdariffa]
MLVNIKVGSLAEDSLRWVADSNGMYKPSTYCKMLTNAQGPTEKTWELVWMNLAPPKVEVFTWKLMHGRIPKGLQVGNSKMAFNISTNFEYHE